MEMKPWAMVSALALAGAAVLWRLVSRRRHVAHALAIERMRHPGRLVAGGGVRRIV